MGYLSFTLRCIYHIDLKKILEANHHETFLRECLTLREKYSNLLRDLDKTKEDLTRHKENLARKKQRLNEVFWKYFWIRERLEAKRREPYVAVVIDGASTDYVGALPYWPFYELPTLLLFTELIP